MRWTVHSEEPLYQDRWLDIRIADVEITGGRHLDHRLIRMAPSVGVVVVDEERRVLLLWRHRFITDAWGWEIPMGGQEEGEDLATAAAREVEEETGWRPGPLTPLLTVHPTAGIADSVHHLYRADDAVQVGEPKEDWEAERIEWVPLADIRKFIDSGQLHSGSTLAALLYVLATE